MAIVGAGFYGEIHTRTLAEHPQVNLKAIVDVDSGRAREIAQKYRVKSCYRTVEEMLKKEDVDAVSIATPEQHHRAPAVAAAQAGKHVFLEKPIAATLEDADAIIKAVKSAGVKLQIGYICRFDPRYAVAKQRIDEGEIGDLVSLWAARRGIVFFAETKGKWSHPLFYMGVHDIDLMRWYAGSEVKHVYAESNSKVCKSMGVPDVVHALLKFRDGAVASIETTWILPRKHPSFEFRMYAVGTKAAIHIDIFNQGLSFSSEKGYEYVDTGVWPVLHGKLAGAVKEQFAHFIRCVQEDKDPIVTGEDGRKSLEIALAIMKSLRDGQVVNLPLG